MRTIAPARGQILANDGSLLATSVPVYDLRWDAKYEGMRWDLYDVYVSSLCHELGLALNKRPSTLKAKFDKAIDRGHRGIDCAKHSILTFQSLRDLPFVQVGRRCKRVGL